MESDRDVFNYMMAAAQRARDMKNSSEVSHYTGQWFRSGALAVHSASVTHVEVGGEESWVFLHGVFPVTNGFYEQNPLEHEIWQGADEGSVDARYQSTSSFSFASGSPGRFYCSSLDPTQTRPSHRRVAFCNATTVACRLPRSSLGLSRLWVSRHALDAPPIHNTVAVVVATPSVVRACAASVLHLVITTPDSEPHDPSTSSPCVLFVSRGLTVHRVLSLFAAHHPPHAVTSIHLTSSALASDDPSPYSPWRDVAHHLLQHNGTITVGNDNAHPLSQGHIASPHTIHPHTSLQDPPSTPQYELTVSSSRHVSVGDSVKHQYQSKRCGEEGSCTLIPEGQRSQYFVRFAIQQVFQSEAYVREILPDEQVEWEDPHATLCLEEALSCSEIEVRCNLDFLPPSGHYLTKVDLRGVYNLSFALCDANDRLLARSNVVLCADGGGDAAQSHTIARFCKELTGEP